MNRFRESCLYYSGRRRRIRSPSPGGRENGNSITRSSTGTRSRNSSCLRRLSIHLLLVLKRIQPLASDGPDPVLLAAEYEFSEIRSSPQCLLDEPPAWLLFLPSSPGVCGVLALSPRLAHWHRFALRLRGGQGPAYFAHRDNASRIPGRSGPVPLRVNFCRDNEWSAARRIWAVSADVFSPTPENRRRAQRHSQRPEAVTIFAIVIAAEGAAWLTFFPARDRRVSTLIRGSS